MYIYIYLYVSICSYVCTHMYYFFSIYVCPTTPCTIISASAPHLWAKVIPHGSSAVLLPDTKLCWERI